MFTKKQLTIKYLAVSLIATAMDFWVFSCCILLIPAHFYTVSTFVGMLVGAIVSWTLHRLWVFADSGVPKRKKKQRYFSGVLLSIALNLGFMYLSCEWLSLPLMTSRVLTSITVWAIIYWFNYNVVFKFQKRYKYL